ncbi:sensor histidine kinase [Salinispora oceanensis]|uniref:sensor histidine kinase n=1 Tax=Salinispora oceanensis TaxID=1050199 RepID=UPI0003671DC7|nr:histidine kinase [Salinispora oceanensis]
MDKPRPRRTRAPSRIRTVAHRLRSSPRLVDTVLYVCLLGVLATDAESLASRPWEYATAPVLIVGAVALSRVRPACSLTLAALSGTSYLVNAGGSPEWPIALMIIIGYLAGRRSADHRSALVGLSGTLAVGLLIAPLTGTPSRWLSMALTVLGAAAVPWLAGRYRRLRADLAYAGWERACQLRREQRTRTSEARTRERARIAREMHDSLGHELSLIALRAGAFELDDGLDERQRRAAGELRATAVAATEHLQEITTMLRDGDGVAIDAAVADLVARARDLGVPISLSEFDETAGAVGDATFPIASDPRASGLTPMAAHALHRVVQEGVTNATRHAAGLPVSVRLHRTADELTVAVTNPLPATSARVAGPHSGQGLLGLHERLRLAGGTVSAGPRDGVFEISAQLPIGARSAPARRIAPEPTGDGILPDQADPPAGPPLGLPQAERRMRRRLMAAAGLPVAAFGALGAVLLGYHLLTVVNTALSPADFDRLRVGQHRDEFAGSLPRRSISSAPPVLIEPPAPADAHCEYYLTNRNPLVISTDMFRLCYTGDTLVTLDRLTRP